jgi:formylglycine-generating enzyme required for sulfatase activity
MVRATCWLLALLGLLNLFWLTRQESQVDPPATRGQARASGFRDLRPRVPGPDDCAFPDRKLKPSLRDQGMNPQGYREYLAADGSVLIHIPAGDYLAAEAPDARGWTGRKTRKIHLEGYYIGKFEVTNAQFARFVRETGYAPFVNVWETYAKKSGDDFPVVYASWRAASAYCKWAGLRLPTIREWERAARGTDGRTYPWGQEWDANRSNNFKLADQKRKSWRADFSAGRPAPAGPWT